MADTTGIQLAAQFGGYGGGDQLARGGQSVEAFEHFVHPAGDGGAALAGELAGRRDIGDGEDPGNDLDVHPGGGDAVAEAEEILGREEELADRAVGPGIDLALEMVEVGLGTGRFRVNLGIASDRNVERRDLLQPGDQIGGGGIAVRMRGKGAAGLGRIAAQRDEVPDPGVPIGLRDRIDFIAAGVDAGEVRRRGERGLGDDPLDRLWVRSRVEPPAP